MTRKELRIISFFVKKIFGVKNIQENMRLAFSNIALTAFDHADELMRAAAEGLKGVEVAPSRAWHDTWEGLSAAHVDAYRAAVERAGLQVVGLHSLFFDHPELGLFKDADGRRRSLDFLVHLSGVCRDLGGHTLIWGGGRRRNALPESTAYREAEAFMGELCQRIEGHGTCFCFEPLGPCDTDFIHTSHDALRVVRAVEHRALRIQLDAKALVENDELTVDTFENVADDLVHFHANEPALAVLGSSGKIDHQRLGAYLRTVGYDGWVSIEQRMLNEKDPLSDLAESARVLREHYE